MRNAFDADSIHYWGKWEGVGPWKSSFFCEKKAPSLENRTKNSGPTPSSGPCIEYCLHQNHYVLRHINNRYINS
jgi:hypothetical protein